MTPKLKDPCMDPNPWDPPFPNALTHDFDRPCGRPKGHDGKGGKGAQWGAGHAEHPNDDDPPTKRVVLRREWTTDESDPTMRIHCPNDGALKITIGTIVVVNVNRKTVGQAGMEMIERTARAVAEALKVKIEEDAR